MKINVITLFSGYDSQCLALDRLKQHNPGFDYELVAWSEIDRFAIQAHNALYPQWADRNLGDVSKIDWEKFKSGNKLEINLLTYSFPCFSEGTLILTDKGYKPIEKIQENDMVLTHTNSFRRVLKPMNRDYNGTMVDIKAMSCGKITLTANHPLYVRRLYRKGHNATRCFDLPEWVKAKDVDRKCYLGYAINQKSEYPIWKGSIDNRFNNDHRINRLSELFQQDAFWYLMGRYVGDGWKRSNGSGIVIAFSNRNKQSLINTAGKLGFNYSIVSEGSVQKMHIAIKELYEFVERYGYYAHGKKIDAETLNLPTDKLMQFVNGYCESDGCRIGKYFKITTVSRELCYGIGQCIAKAFHRPFSVYFTKRSPQCVIGGRIVNQRDSYSIVWKASTDKQDQAFYEDGYIWFPITSIRTYNAECKVFNMSVETDESYTANGVIAHNCQDISNAGRQRGFSVGGGTRSGLLWECEKAIRILRPDALLMENVKALASEKFLPDLLKWSQLLESYGYHNFWSILNAKDFGVPQNRERFFMVSTLADTQYQFPKPFKLELTLDDVLDDDVDAKFYLSNERIDELIGSTIKEMQLKDGFVFKAKKKSGQV